MGGKPKTGVEREERINSLEKFENMATGSGLVLAFGGLAGIFGSIALDYDLTLLKTSAYLEGAAVLSFAVAGVLNHIKYRRQ